MSTRYNGILPFIYKIIILAEFLAKNTKLHPPNHISGYATAPAVLATTKKPQS